MGTAIRMGRKLGLHVDGKLLGLPPFETEMRRRLWWQLIVLDAKSATISGFKSSAVLRNWSTELPRNLADEDMHPDAREDFKERDGPTDMIFCLMAYKATDFLLATGGDFEGVMMAADLPDNHPPNSVGQSHRRTVERLGLELQAFTDRYHLHPGNGPVHALASKLKEYFVKKLCTATPEPPSTSNQQNPDDVDRAFRLAIIDLEHNEQNLGNNDPRFFWFSRIYFQPFNFIYVVSQLCQAHSDETTNKANISADLIDRAWRQISCVYQLNPDLFDMTNRLYFQLALKVLEAWQKRSQALLRQTGAQPPVPSYVEKLASNIKDGIGTNTRPVTRMQMGTGTVPAATTAGSTVRTGYAARSNSSSLPPRLAVSAGPDATSMPTANTLGQGQLQESSQYMEGIIDYVDTNMGFPGNIWGDGGFGDQYQQSQMQMLDMTEDPSTGPLYSGPLYFYPDTQGGGGSSRGMW